MLDQFKNLKTLLETFPDEQSCIDYMFELRPYCPHCEYKKIYRYSDGKNFKCSGCKKRFTMKTGTAFANSNLPLRKWFIIIYLNTQNKKGMSSYSVAEEAEVTQKTAWQRLTVIRKVLGKDQPTQMAGVIEADETYAGGKNKNRHYNKRQRKNLDKTVVFGMLSRSSGKVRTVVTGNRNGDVLQKEIYRVMHRGHTIITDDHHGYFGLHFDYKHIILNRSAYEYVRHGILSTDKPAHNNTIEGFWPFIDRSIYGTYHKFSPKHLQLYANECTFRYNTRKLTRTARMELALSYIYGEVKIKEIISQAKDPRNNREDFRFRPK